MKQGIVKKNIPTIKGRIINAENHPLLRFHSLFQNKLRDPVTFLNNSLPAYIRKERKLRENEEIFHATFNQAAIGIAHVDLKGRFIRVNNKFCKITGWKQRELLHKTIFDITTKEDLKKDKRYFTALSRSKIMSHTIEKRYISKNGNATWVRVTRSFVKGSSGRKKFIVTIVEDINDEIKMRSALQLLSEAGKILSTSLDFNKTITSITKIAIPQLADVCIVDLLDENNTFNRVKVAHQQPKDKQINALYAKYPPTANRKTFVEQAIALKKSLMIKNITHVDEKKYARDENHFADMQEMGVKSIMAVPMISHDKVVGVLTFVSTNEYRRYTKVDLLLAEQFAARATLAIENAKLYQSANEAILQRDEFLSIASHELKNPLTSIKGFIQILVKKLNLILDDPSKSMLIQVEDQLDRLNRLISDLLDFTSIRADRLVLNCEMLDVNKVAADTVDLCQQLTQKQKIIIQGKITSMVEADKHRFMQVLSNLLTNAIKYSPDNKNIIVELKQTADEAVIKVQDFGHGIPPNTQKQIFERFYRSATSRKKNISGLGLGLYITSEIVKKHNGRIWVESIPKKGSAFYFALPLVVHTTVNLQKQAQQKEKTKFAS